MTTQVLHFTSVIGDKRINDFMSHFDMRPPNKLFYQTKRFSLTMTDLESILSEDDLRTLFDQLVLSLKDHYYVASVVFDGFMREGRLYSDIELRYRDETIEVLSDGKHWHYIGRENDSIARN